MTDVVTVEELFPVFGSAFRLLIEAVSFNVLFAGAVTFSVIDNTVPFSDDQVSGAIDPTLHVATPADAVQVKLVVVHASLRLTTEQLTLLPEPLTNVVPVGSGSVIVTPVAWFGPKFVPTIAYVMFFPVLTLAKPRFRIARSALGPTTV